MELINTGERIARLRKQFSLTQEQLADKLSVSAQAVSKWETGATSPDIMLLPKLSEVFRVSIDELFGISKKAVLSENADTSKLMLHIKVFSAAGDRVAVNVPFKLVSLLIAGGGGFVSFGTDSANQALKDIDWKSISEAIEMGLRGKVVDVLSAAGDTVEIVIE